MSVFLVSPNVSPSSVQAEMEILEFSPQDDAHILDVYPNINYGTESTLSVGRYAAGYLEMWFRFNLSEIPEALKIRSATLKLYLKQVFGEPENIFVDVHSAGIDWNGEAQGNGNETTLTWENKPEFRVHYTSSSFAGDEFSAAEYTRIPLNLTDVRYWSQSDDRILSLSLRSPTQIDPDASVDVYSKEEGASIPYLRIVVASEGAEPNSQIAVLVDKSLTVQIYYEYYMEGVGKWLEWWKMDFSEIDISSIAITRSLLSEYNVVVISQFNLTENGNLDSSEVQAIEQAVYEDGVGLVQIDAYLQGYMNLWPDYNKLFNVTVNNWVSTSNKMNLAVVNNTHFITEIYENGTEMNCLFPDEWQWKESDLVFENVTVGSEATSLVRMPYENQSIPALIAKTHGNGRTVLSTFSTGRESLEKGGYDGFGERANFKTSSGIHGLLWRSITWTAKKPFVFMGMPPFITFRVDDVASTYNPAYIDKLLEYGFFVNLYIFQDNTYAGGQSYQNLLKNYYWNGSVHIAPHAWNPEECIYWNLASDSEYQSSTLSTYFTWLDANYTTWNITPSAFIVPHQNCVGENALPFLEEREWVFVSTTSGIPPSEGDLTGCWIWDADWKRIAHLDYSDSDNVIFNVHIEMPVGDPSYAFQDCLMGAQSNPAKVASQMLSCMEHGLSDLFWAEAFTHEQWIEFSPNDWDQILTSVFDNITAHYPFTLKASKEYIARYAFNRRHLSISSYDYTGNNLTLNLSGTSNLPLALYLFTDQKISNYSGMLDYFRTYDDDGYMVWIPPYSNNHHVTLTFGEAETTLPHIHFTTANITSTSTSTSQLTIDAKPIWKHDKPLYLFKINCGDLGSPEKINFSDGTPINFLYNEDTGIVTFNGTLSETRKTIIISIHVCTFLSDIHGPEGLPDGVVDMWDFSFIGLAYGKISSDPDWEDYKIADTRGPEGPPDGIVDMWDFGYCGLEYGQSIYD